MDDLVDLEIEVIEKILKKITSDPEPEDVKNVEKQLWERIMTAITNGRRTGLGLTGLGDLFAYLNVSYGSDESIDLTDRVYKILAIESHRSSVTMAKERGAFPVFSFDLERGHKHLEKILSCDDELREQYERYGRRNIANTTTAPAGSTSLLTQTTSGCEPVLFLKARRKRKITPNDKMSRVDEIDKLGDKWQYYDVFHKGVELWSNVTGNDRIEESPYYGSTVEDIDFLKKIMIQAKAQHWIDHSISNTLTLPGNVTNDVVSDLCLNAWKLGCKGITVYRTGSRDAVIVKNDDKKSENVEIKDTNAPKRPKELRCDIHRTTVQGEAYLVLIGLLNDKPYEVFAGLLKHVEVPKKSKHGVLVKNGRNKDGIATYNLTIPFGDDDEVVFKDVVNLFDNPIYGAFTRTISLALRHGVPVQYLVEQLRKDKASDITSFSSCIARVLSKSYIPDGTKSNLEKKCPQCGGSNINYQQGCSVCGDCGYSRCA
jgi:ribonucleoside-diphosphate reductase alpha chain